MGNKQTVPKSCQYIDDQCKNDQTKIKAAPVITEVIENSASNNQTRKSIEEQKIFQKLAGKLKYLKNIRWVDYEIDENDRGKSE